MVSYYELIKKIDEIMPQKYKEGFIQEKYYETSYCGYGEAEWGNYRINKGILPTEFAFYDAKRPENKYKMSKGEQYIVEKLYFMAKSEDYRCIAPLFVYTFLEQFGHLIQSKIKYKKDYDRYDKVIYYSINALKSGGYSLVDYRCNWALPVGFAYDDVEDMIINTSIDEAETFAKLIVDSIDLILSQYNVYYLRYPKAEYEKQEEKINSALGMLHEFNKQIYQQM